MAGVLLRTVAAGQGRLVVLTWAAVVGPPYLVSTAAITWADRVRVRLLLLLLLVLPTLSEHNRQRVRPRAGWRRRRGRGVSSSGPRTDHRRGE